MQALFSQIVSIASLTRGIAGRSGSSLPGVPFQEESVPISADGIAIAVVFFEKSLGFSFLDPADFAVAGVYREEGLEMGQQPLSGHFMLSSPSVFRDDDRMTSAGPDDSLYGRLEIVRLIFRFFKSHGSDFDGQDYPLSPVFDLHPYDTHPANFSCRMTETVCGQKIIYLFSKHTANVRKIAIFVYSIRRIWQNLMISRRRRFRMKARRWLSLGFMRDSRLRQRIT